MRQAGLALLVVPALGLAALAGQPQAPGVAILYPPNGCQVARSQVRIVCVAPRALKDPGVRLNGRPVRLTRVLPAEGWYPRAIRRGASPRPALLDSPDEAALWYGTVKAPLGMHTLTAGGSRVRFEQTGSTKLSRTVLLREHPATGAHPCGGCHPMAKTEDGATIGEPSVPDGCQKCHPAARLQTIHKHIMEPLKRCWTCHDPHGSTRAHLLTDTRERLCSRCHALGHTKP